MPKAGIRFGGNAYFKQLLADERGKLTMAKQFMAGLGAGATGRSTYPAIAIFSNLPSFPHCMCHCVLTVSC